MYHILVQENSFAMTLIICRDNLMQKSYKSHLTNTNAAHKLLGDIFSGPEADEALAVLAFHR